MILGRPSAGRDLRLRLRPKRVGCLQFSENCLKFRHCLFLPHCTTIYSLHFPKVASKFVNPPRASMLPSIFRKLPQILSASKFVNPPRASVLPSIFRKLPQIPSIFWLQGTTICNHQFPKVASNLVISLVT